MSLHRNLGLVVALAIVASGTAHADDPILPGGIPAPPTLPPPEPAPNPEPPPTPTPTPTDPRGSPDEPARNFPDPTGPEYSFRTPGERSTKNIVTAASIAAGAALFGGLGLYFHLDSRDAAARVTATTPTNHPWGPADQASYDQASSSRTKAIVFYSLGGAATIAAAVYLIVTQPPDFETTIRPHRNFVPKVDVAPSSAVVGGTWSW